MQSQNHNIRQIKPLAIFIFLSYIGLIFSFRIIDIYNKHFYSTGLSVICYNLTRLGFCLGLIWIIYYSGYRILTLASKQDLTHLDTLDCFIASMLTGSAAAHIILFISGLVGLYSWPALAIVTMTIFFISLPHLSVQLKIPHLTSRIDLLGASLCLAPIAFFIMVKGLYPAGGHDYYNHYFHFYRNAVDHGSILPNEAWYHFYYSKGMGVFFASMILTDALAPQLAAMSLIFAAAAIVFSILRRSSSPSLIPWLGVGLYFTFLIYTAGPIENMRQGGWGDLEKPHESAAVFMLGILWITMNLLKTKHSKLWLITLVSSITTIVLINPPMSVFVSCYLTISSIYCLIAGKKSLSRDLFLTAIYSGLCLVAVWSLNYLITGLPDDQTLFMFWPYLNFSKIDNLGLTFELFLAHWLKTTQIANKVPLSLDILPKLVTYLRIDVWWLLLALSLITLAIAALFRKQRQYISKFTSFHALAILAIFLLSVFSIALFIGRDQPISFYRLTTFTYAPMLCFCLLIVTPILRNITKQILFITLIFSSYYFMIENQEYLFTNNIFMKNYMSNIAGRYNINDIKNVITNTRLFISGKYSLADAYKNQSGWPGRMPWGGIYPPAETVWRILPPNTHVWSMHIHSYCMLPECHMEGFQSFRLSPHTADVYFGSPEQAKLALQQANHDYFFISNSLQLTDPLANTTLFTPENLPKYFGVIWTDGDNTLLTWKESAKQRIDSAWLRQYKKNVTESSMVNSFPYAQMKSILSDARTERKITASDIPWHITGWN